MHFILHCFIHSLIFYTAYPLQVVGEMEPIPADTGQEIGYALERSPLYHGFCVAYDTEIKKESLQS